MLSNENDIDRLEKAIRGNVILRIELQLFVDHLDKEPMIKLAMSRQENRHNRPGMDLVRDEVSYGVR